VRKRHPAQDAFDEGAAAYRRDLPRSACPHEFTTFEADAWHLGWTASFLKDAGVVEDAHRSGGHHVTHKHIDDPDARARADL
jgi:hypothetical protein